MVMIIALLTVLGLCFGSFANALVWRIYQQHLPKKKRAGSDADLSIARGRSMCPHCNHTLAPTDLIPVLSWLTLRGRCRYCQKSISAQYPLVELVTAGVFVASYVFWPDALNNGTSYSIFAIWLVASVGFVALIVYDIRWMLLPNRIVFPLAAIAALSAVLQVLGSHSLPHTTLMALSSVAVAGGIFYGLFQLSGGKWIGGGDVKLGFVIGLLLGSPALAFMMLFTASALGLIVSLPAVLLHKKKLASRIPFGPFLIVATIIVQLFGQSILDWYVATVLYL